MRDSIRNYKDKFKSMKRMKIVKSYLTNIAKSKNIWKNIGKSGKNLENFGKSLILGLKI